jgi:hypothetical protein
LNKINALHGGDGYAFDEEGNLNSANAYTNLACG